jgi:ankyrin repeat protein
MLFAAVFALRTQIAHAFGEQNLHPDALLLEKARVGDIEAVKQMLYDGVDPNTPPGAGDNGMSALMYSSLKGHDKIVKLLIDADANVNALSSSGSTALMFAAYGGDVKSINELLKKANTNSDVQASNGMTALILAINEGHTDVVKVLSKKGNAPQFRIGHDLKTPLMKAVLKGNLETVNALLESNPNLEARDDHGRSVLMYAVQKGNIGILTALLDMVADPNAVDADRASVLNWAIAFNYSEIVLILQQRGAR